MINQAKREALQEQLEAFDAAGAPFRAALHDLDRLGLPHRAALASIASARDHLLEGLGAQIAGTCEHCKRLLLAGDLGSTPWRDENFIYCESCSPTWADLIDSLPENAAEDDEDQADLRRMLLQRQEEGSLGEKAGLEFLEAQTEVF